MEGRSIRHVSVISPHLDDAAFSLAAFLELPTLPPREVFTVFTEARADSDPRHSYAMGFSSPLSEFEARRREDEQAMNMLGVPFSHAGAYTDRLTPDVVGALVQRILDGKEVANLLVLLPAGAGGHLTRLSRFFRRIRRIPLGSPPHGEHETVRDELGQRLGGTKVTIGYYAEIPYLWADSLQRIVGTLSSTAQQRWFTVRVRPDVERKRAVAKAYESQFVHEFGKKSGYQRRSLAIPEAVFLPR